MSQPPQTGTKRPFSANEEEESLSDIDEDELLGTAGDNEEGDEIADSLLCKLNLSDEEETAEESVETPSHQDRGLNLRDYQLELSSLAVKGENTVVHAATGAGKTRVAFYIVKKHLEKNPSGKVIITAEKNFLVKQHDMALRKLLPDYLEYAHRVEQGNSSDLHLLIDSYSIFLLTPALIENTKQHDPEFLSKFSLLILDECHHTKGDAKYNRIMVWYHLLKEERKPVPQIVGLTATFGTNRSNTNEAAKNHVLKIMANLDVAKISIVTENCEEYERFRKDIKTVTKVLPDIQGDDEVYKLVAQAMARTEELISSCRDQVDSQQPEELELLMVLNKRQSLKRGNETYTTWLGDLENKAAALYGKRQDVAQVVSVGAKYLKIYQDVIEINHQITGDCALEVLERRLEVECFGKHSKQTDKIEVDFANIAKDLETQINNMLTKEYKLDKKPVNVLLEILKEKTDSKARYVVLVKKRTVAELLTRILKKEGFNVATFTGSAASSDVGGTTRSEQESALKQFNDGDIDGLVATNIAEEGLDIPNLNLSIPYYYVGNEVSTRQTAGRIRASKGERYVLAHAKDQVREARNLQRGLLMDEAMKLVLAMPEVDVRTFLAKEHKRIVQSELQRNEQKAREAKRVKIDNSRYKMVCGKCTKFEVSCSKLRCINGQHHAVVDPEIWSKFAMKPFPKQPPRTGDILFQGRLFGAGIKDGNPDNKCTHELGTVSKFRDATLPLLSYKMVRVIDTDTKRSFKLNKWSDAPFVVQNLMEPDDLDLMMSCDPTQR